MAGAAQRLHGLQDRVDARLKAIRDQDVVRRIWQCDHTVWKPDPTEITSPGRLGWLTVIDPMLEEADALDRFGDEVAAEGFQTAVLLGMGGSSLAPEVFHRTYGARAGRLDLRVLDTTDPKEVLALARAIDLDRTLFIVASKSGATVETLAHLAYFWERVPDGRSFIAIADAGTPLEALARGPHAPVREGAADDGAHHHGRAPRALTPRGRCGPWPRGGRGRPPRPA